jgi:PAS domain-containing protein
VNVQALVDAAAEPVVVLDRERRVVAASEGLRLETGRRAPEDLLGRDGVLVLYLDGPPELSA